MSVHRITRLRSINSYLVPEDDGLPLVDTAIRGSSGALLGAAERLGRPIVRILLTHAHVDHVGSVETLPTRTVEAGERIGSLEAVAAPGHTPGQLAFLDTRDRTLYCGDAYATLGGVRVASRPRPPFPFPALFSRRRDVALETARASRALDPACLAPGHGAVVDRPGAAMDDAIAKG